VLFDFSLNCFSFPLSYVLSFLGLSLVFHSEFFYFKFANFFISLPPGNTRYSLYRRLGGPQGRSERVRKISPPPIRVHKHTHINNAITNNITTTHVYKINSKYIRLHPTNAYRPSTATLYYPLSVPDRGDRFRRHKMQ